MMQFDATMQRKCNFLQFDYLDNYV